MPARYRNLFFLVGVAAVIAMLASSGMSWGEVLAHVRRAGFWFPAAVALWLFIYMINAWSWKLIIDDGGPSPLGYWRVLKLTISGYALNNVTPVGLLGGEPYRIMEVSSYVGRARAASSVILYAMMHIFSHFCFWLFSIGLFLLLYASSLTWGVVLLLLPVVAFCLLGVYFFLAGYRDGLVLRLVRIFGRWPLIGRRITQLAERHADALRTVNNQIAALHGQSRTTFWFSLLLEFAARMVGCLEYLFILSIFTHDITYLNCVLIQAFVSLFANLFFFIPMQMGSKEGGLAIVSDIMHLQVGYGVLTGLLTRLRELIWVVIGLLLIYLGNKSTSHPNDTPA